MDAKLVYCEVLGVLAKDKLRVLAQVILLSNDLNWVSLKSIKPELSVFFIKAHGHGRQARIQFFLVFVPATFGIGNHQKPIA